MNNSEKWPLFSWIIKKKLPYQFFNCCTAPYFFITFCVFSSASKSTKFFRILLYILNKKQLITEYFLLLYKNLSGHSNSKWKQTHIPLSCQFITNTIMLPLKEIQSYKHFSVLDFLKAININFHSIQQVLFTLPTFLGLLFFVGKPWKGIQYLLKAIDKINVFQAFQKTLDYVLFTEILCWTFLINWLLHESKTCLV